MTTAVFQARSMFFVLGTLSWWSLALCESVDSTLAPLKPSNFSAATLVDQATSGNYLEGVSKENKGLLETTLYLMAELNIRTRDTFRKNQNLDDFYSNGNVYNGHRRFEIKFDDKVPYAIGGAKKAYEIPGLVSIAWDSYIIRVPSRLAPRIDPIIHECVHFLQHSTLEEERKYPRSPTTTPLEYIRQRTELEAHLVQILYIIKYDKHRLNKHLSVKQQTEVVDMLKIYKEKQSDGAGFQAYLICNNAGLI